MPALETYARAANQARGMDHLRAIQSLRQYMRTTAVVDLLGEIEHLNEPELLRTLVEAGLNATLLKATTTRYDDIVKRMAGVR